MKRSTKIIRVDPNFDLDLKKVAQIRLTKGLAKFDPKELSTAEMTRLLRRTQGYQISMEELKTKEKRR